MSTKPTWKNGQGKLGIFAPLLGTWHVYADAQQGKLHCVRSFKKTLDDTYIELTAIWYMGNGIYEEHALFGCDAEGNVRFWSFTSDGKQSNGELTDVTELHPEAFGFIARMPAGMARQAYWPDETQGFHWVVESESKKGWDRFVDHHYLAEAQPLTATEEALVKE